MRVLRVEFMSSEVKLVKLVGVVHVLEDQPEGEVDQNTSKLLFKGKVSAVIFSRKLVELVEELGCVDEERVPHERKRQGGPVDVARSEEANARGEITPKINT